MVNDFHGKFPGRGFFWSDRIQKFFRWNYGVFSQTNSENKSCGTLTHTFKKVRILTMASPPPHDFSPRMYWEMDSALLWAASPYYEPPYDHEPLRAPHTVLLHHFAKPHKLPNPWTPSWLYSYASGLSLWPTSNRPAQLPRLIQCRSASLWSADIIHGFGQSAFYAIGNSILYTL